MNIKHHADTASLFAYRCYFSTKVKVIAIVNFHFFRNLDLHVRPAVLIGERDETTGVKMRMIY
jgi:hypothetical protein